MPIHNPQDWAPRDKAPFLAAFGEDPPMPSDNREYFRPPIVSAEFLAAFDSVEKVLRERFSEELSKLTREQFIEAMAQAVACGDFMRQLVIGETSTVDMTLTYRHRQGITYVPYREVCALKARIKELEEKITDLERDAEEKQCGEDL